jgi:hypothetical protein
MNPRRAPHAQEVRVLVLQLGFRYVGKLCWSDVHRSRYKSQLAIPPSAE